MDDSLIIERKRKINGNWNSDSSEKVFISSETKEMQSPVLFRSLAGVFGRISGTRKRLEIQRILGSYFKSVIHVSSPDDLIASVYITLNKVAPDYEGIELGVGESILLKAIADSTGRSLKQLKVDLQRDGDIGIIASRSRSCQLLMMKPAPLTVKGVFETLKMIATISGKDSQSKKLDRIKSVLTACQNGDEAKFFIRALSGKLRIGLAEQTVITCLAHAFGKEEDVDVLKTAIAQCPNYEKVIRAIMEHGVQKLGQHCLLECSTPIKPMLAHPVR